MNTLFPPEEFDMVWLQRCCLSLALILTFGDQALAGRPDFKTANIEVGNKKLKVELALDNEQRAYGLMKIKSFPKGIDGMLFVFESPRTLNFWMKNTWMPLSIAFFDKNKVLINIEDMEPESEMIPDSKRKHYQSIAPAKYALEVPKSWFEKHKIRKGHVLKIPKL